MKTTYRSLSIIDFAVVPNEHHIFMPLLDVFVLGLLQVLPHSGDIHWVFDDLWVVNETESLPIHWLSELERLGVLAQALHDGI